MRAELIGPRGIIITPPFDYFAPGMLSRFVTYFNNSRVIKLHSNTAERMTDRG
jgi:hypothetical protein